MRSVILHVLGTALGMAGWATLVFLGTVYGWWQKPLAPADDAAAFTEAVRDEIDSSYRGNVAFRLIEEGDVHDEYFVSIGDPVDGGTLFPAASLSKWVSAWGVMRLVEEGRLDLDAPVSTYLTRWALPETDFDNSEVTIRRLLSHTAGLTDGLGYAGFAPGLEVQPLEESLTHASDASPGADGRVRVGLVPGSRWVYSGGGFALLQLVVEEVAGESFESYMQRVLFGPLGMDRSTFLIDARTTPNLAATYDLDGTEATHYQFAALAPTALYTTAADMTRFIQAHLVGTEGGTEKVGVLTPNTLKLMRKPHGHSMGADIWGLGTMLFAPNGDNDFVIGHDGSNEPAINTAVRLNPASGDGIVILETGNELLATTLAGDWVFWQTGTIDVLKFTMVADTMISIIVAGWVVMILSVSIIFWRRTRAARA